VDQVAARQPLVMVAGLQIIDIEIFQQMVLWDKDSQADQEYDLINKAKTYTLPEAEVEQVVAVSADLIMLMMAE
jgi:hypothetical protein